MKSLNYLITILTALSLFGCNNYNNQQPIDYAYTIKDNFNIIDANKDNYITLQEAQALIPGLDKETFLLIDYDQDEQLSFEELNQYINENKTCGSTVRRGISCASQRVQSWVTDFITLLFSITMLWYIPRNSKTNQLL